MELPNQTGERKKEEAQLEDILDIPTKVTTDEKI